MIKFTKRPKGVLAKFRSIAFLTKQLDLSEVFVYGKLRVRLTKGSQVKFGNNVVLNSMWTRNTLESNSIMTIQTLHESAHIEIGDNTGISSSTISAQKSISIGARVLIGAGCMITDTDHHHVDGQPEDRRFAGLPIRKYAQEIIIGDDVFIGARTIILKGSRIGNGSVIGAGSVVSGLIPENCVAAGNPCKVIRQIRLH